MPAVHHIRLEPIPAHVRRQIIGPGADLQNSAARAAVLFTDVRKYFVSRRRSNSASEGHMIHHQARLRVDQAANEFKDQTTPQQLWQTASLPQDHRWGWYYLSTVLATSRATSLGWKLCATGSPRTLLATLARALSLGP